MALSTSRLAGLAIVASVFAFPPAGATNLQQELNDSCRTFVSQFYNSYNPIDPDQPAEPALIAGGSGDRRPSRTDPIDPDLIKQMREFFKAEASSGRILLDFDPVINSRRAADSYVAGRLTRKGEHYLVEVYGVSDGRQHDHPDVVAELVFQVGAWTFVNFHYPNHADAPSDENLLSLLKQFRKSLRQEPAR
ncbi:MAG TPA: hypothetical protein VMB02_08380 [Candidatus Aquilonibacter sp.]|nr:hypothetical protein [Candidatus Aquilonibacter sp.]